MATYDKEWKKEYNKQYYQKLKTAESGLSNAKASIAALEEKGGRYRSECLSATDLGKIYFGESYKETPQEDEDEGSGRKKKLAKLPKPSNTPILGKVREFQEWLDLR